MFLAVGPTFKVLGHVYSTAMGVHNKKSVYHLLILMGVIMTMIMIRPKF